VLSADDERACATAVYVDAIADDNNVAPERAIPWLIDSMVSAAKSFPDWTVEDLGVPVRLHVPG
jgi:hypothetical protein